MGKLDMMYHLIDHGLSNQVVFDRGRIQRADKIHLKTLINIKPIKWSNMSKLDMVYHLIDHGFSYQMVLIAVQK